MAHLLCFAYAAAVDEQVGSRCCRTLEQQCQRSDPLMSCFAATKKRFARYDADKEKKVTGFRP